MSLLAILSPLVLAAAAPASLECAAIPGFEHVLADDGLRWIVIGEVHGSNEVPALFADAVCLASRSRPVIVGLEQPSTDQPAIDAFMASDGGEEARRAFFQASLWNNRFKDGRSSEAYFRLFETLRQMRAEGRIAGVTAFVPVRIGDEPPGAYERDMAELLKNAARPGSVVLALVGNVHSMRVEVPRPDPYLAMAGHLPASQTATFNTLGEGGDTWSCIRRAGAPAEGAGGGGADPIECGPHSNGRPLGRERGIEMNANADAPYSGVIYLGVPTTASPPATPAAAR